MTYHTYIYICEHIITHYEPHFTIPLYWLFNRDSPFLHYSNPQYVKGSIIPQRIINQQGFSSHCSSIIINHKFPYVGNITTIANILIGLV